MTKSFSALGAILVIGLGLPAHADLFDDVYEHVNIFHGEYIQNGYGGPEPFPEVLPPVGRVETHQIIIRDWIAPETADLPDWVHERGGASAEHTALMRWSSTRPETWGEDSIPYQISFPGPFLMGLIPNDIPEGWVVTHRCLAWDYTYASAEQPFGDCYIFDMSPIANGPIIAD